MGTRKIIRLHYYLRKIFLKVRLMETGTNFKFPYYLLYLIFTEHIHYMGTSSAEENCCSKIILNVNISVIHQLKTPDIRAVDLFCAIV